MKGQLRWTRWRHHTQLHMTVLCLSLVVRLVCGEQRFVQEPEDVTAKHGDSVTLQCKVADRKGAVQWTKDAFGLGTDPDLQGFNRYRMEVNDSDGEYIDGLTL
ncbi:hypothetical protein Pcinc_028918 [Petrolisthes cinctipes]|uniref:Immunoglobulin I-set domain-containing protein n=1 Tax=Petrolisthes cinctipes TaxID=88211 RepID=A0AAE1K8A4_PETCI|nr:hypothetical protein Pcinc_028918 [Petrolisthes cinctipes]